MHAQAPAALLEIDFQQWIVDLANDHTVIARARQLRDVLRTQGSDVYCLRYLDPAPGPRADPTSREAAFVDTLKPGPRDIVLSKHGKDAFENPDLHANLQGHGTTHLILTGLLTDHGVALTAKSAHALGYHVTVEENACATTTKQAHHQALRQLRQHGIAVV
ncbi:hydrolase [Nocardiopsis tropica]|uniref:cysteine hydrolase family protein n=1 Tax=Tsukamurella strandjordii TaxID=147577 RepID=UPI0031DD91AB